MEDEVEPATDEEIRQALVTLLSAMRPDWGNRQAILKRVVFAEERLQWPLIRVCVEAVRGASKPGSLRDIFIDVKAPIPSDGRPADPKTVAEVASRARRALIGRKPSSRPKGAV